MASPEPPVASLPEPPPACGVPVLARRAASAVATVGLLFGALVLDLRLGVGWGFAAFLSLACVAALREFWRFADARGMTPFRALGYASVALWPLATEWWCLDQWHDAAPFDLPWALDPQAVAAALAILGPMLAQLARRTTEGALANVSVSILGSLYCGALPTMFLKIRHLSLPGSTQGWAVDGVEAVAFTVVLVKGADVGALLVGRVWGRRKLIPRVSPGKTVEGALGGALFSVFLACLLVTALPELSLAKLGYPKIVVMGVWLAAASLAGDLVESAFKRDSGVKDAGNAIPGFGGVLDLVDSLIVGAPAMYALLLVYGAHRG